MNTNKHTYYFRNKDHIYKASVNYESGTIVIGGSYDKCLNMSFKNSETLYIDHVQSEPECSFDYEMKNGESVALIKASIQFCKELFPAIKFIDLYDASKIECGVSKSTKPPRSRAKPLSLPHLYIANYGKTWYEAQFSAKINDEALYKTYRDRVSILSSPIEMPFSVFEKDVSVEQASFLKPYFETAISWNMFFKSVPIKQRCFAFYNWLPFFINKLIANAFNPEGWRIDYDIMPKTEMIIIDQSEYNRQYGGKNGNKKMRKTRKRRYSNRTVFKHSDEGYMM